MLLRHNNKKVFQVVKRIASKFFPALDGDQKYSWLVCTALLGYLMPKSAFFLPGVIKWFQVTFPI